MEHFIFYLFAALAAFSAALVVLQRRAIYSALSLIVCLGSVAVLFFNLGANFIGAIQIIVYAGAIMVLFVYVVMLIDPETDQFEPNRLKRVSIIGIPAGALLVLILVSVFSDSASSASASALPSQNLTLLASQLFSDYLLPFEVTSILVLVAVMGAIVLTKRPDSK